MVGGKARFLFFILCICSPIFSNGDTTSCRLLEELSKSKSSVRYTPRLKIPTVIRGGDERTFTPSATGTSVREITQYDTVIVGGGLAGLTSGIFLTDAKQRVLLLEKESSLGGLAAGGEKGGMRYARGGAYFSAPDRREYRIFQHLGLGNYKKKFSIEEPIDSYLINKSFYPGVWEAPSLEKLPKNFALFKHVLEKLEEETPIQPIEESGLLQWDHLNAAQWIRSFPQRAAELTDTKSRKIYAEFLQDSRINRADPMSDVLKFVNLFSRSALGWELEHVSATAFANFYVSEIVPRYTGILGNGDISERLETILKARAPQISIRTGSPVARIENLADGVEVTFLQDGVTRKVRAKRLIFAAPLGVARQLITDLERIAPEHYRILGGLQYAHYAVHNVFVEGHPWRETYDLWAYRDGYSERDPTDIILGRWQDRGILGYHGMRNFESHPKDNTSILTIYQPLPKDATGKDFGDARILDLVDSSVQYTIETLGPMLLQRWGTQIKVRSVETSRWPFSIHIVAPGWLSQVQALCKPVGNIFFGNNNLGLPSVEEALYRGERAAHEVLESLNQAMPDASNVEVSR